MFLLYINKQINHYRYNIQIDTFGDYSIHQRSISVVQWFRMVRAVLPMMPPLTSSTRKGADAPREASISASNALISDSCLIIPLS